MIGQFSQPHKKRREGLHRKPARFFYMAGAVAGLHIVCATLAVQSVTDNWVEELVFRDSTGQVVGGVGGISELDGSGDERREGTMIGREAYGRVKGAIHVITKWGGGIWTVDGDHHKQWVLDQALRKLMTEREYERFRLESPDWREGIAP